MRILICSRFGGTRACGSMKGWSRWDATPIFCIYVCFLIAVSAVEIERDHSKGSMYLSRDGRTIRKQNQGLRVSQNLVSVAVLPGPHNNQMARLLWVLHCCNTPAGPDLSQCCSCIVLQLYCVVVVLSAGERHPLYT